MKSGWCASGKDPQVIDGAPLRRSLVIVALVVAACGGGSATPLASPTPRAVSSPEPSRSPVAVSGVIAIGHSGLTGEGTGAVFEAVPANSYATGSAPAVNSVYLRLRALRPDLAGVASNHARGGAVASALPGQAAAALAEVPYPALAIISTIDNDIRCDGTDAAHVPELGASVAQALDLITKASPQTKILIVGQLGRPSIPFIEAQVAADPTVKATLTGVGPCDFYGLDGRIVPGRVETLKSVIQAYEDEEAGRCAAVPQCTTDGGVRAAWVDRNDYFSGNTGHLNVAGQAAEAANIWPVVARIFGLPPSS